MPYLTGDAGDFRANETSLRSLWDGLRRRRWLIAGATLASMLLAAVVLAVSTPLYESEATLRIVTEDQSGGLLGSLPSITEVALPDLGTDEIDTELGVLRSRRIAAAVVDSLALQVELSEPRVARDSVFRVIEAPHNSQAGVFTYEAVGEGDYRLVDVDAPAGTPRTERARVGEPVRLGEVTIQLVPAIEEVPHERIRIIVLPFQRAVEQLREQLSVDKQEGGSQLVELRYRAPHPLLANAVVEAVVGTYLEYTSSTSHRDLRKRVETLNEQVSSYQTQLREAEEELRAYREQNQIVDPEEQATQQVRLLADVTAAREQALIEREALLRLLQEVRRENPDQEISPYRKLAAFPSFITNQGVQAMLESLNELETARSELLVLRTPQNADVRQLDERISQLEEQLFRLATDYLQGLESQIASSDASLARFGSGIESLPERELAYARLLREQRLLNEVYLTLQTRLKEAEVQYAVAPDEVRVIDAALVPEEPVSPRPLVTMILATILGLMVGVTAAVAREAVDTSVRSQREVEEATSGLPVVGIIPRMRLPGGRLARLRTGWQRRLPASVGRLSAEPAGLLMGGESDAGAAEAFRALRTSISRGASHGSPRMLVLTSPRQGDGKSLSAANLALSLARTGDRVLLVDADLRDGELYRLLGGARSPGLADVLEGRTAVADALQRVELENAGGASLTFLASGTRPRSPSDLVASDGMARLLDELRNQFDRVLIDAPALQRVADGARLGMLADAALLVVRAGSTDRGILQQTVQRLRRLEVPIGGVILNDVELGGEEFNALPSPFGSENVS